MVLQQLDTHLQKYEPLPYLTTTDLHVRAKTIIFIEENISKNLSDLELA